MQATLQTVSDQALSWVQSHPRSSLVLLSSGLAVTYAWLSRRRDPPLPPGPMGLPLVGSMFSLSKDLHLDLMEYGRIYGDIFTIKIGHRHLVVLNSLAAIREAFLLRGNDFADRSEANLSSRILEEEMVGGAYTEAWKIEKKFAIQSFRSARMRAEGDILAEMVAMVTDLQELEEQPTDMLTVFHLVTGNIIADLIFSDRFEHRDPALHRFIALIKNWYRSFNKFCGLALFIPPLLARLVSRRMLTELRLHTRALQDYIDVKVYEHQETFRPERVRDILDTYLRDRDIDAMGHAPFRDTMIGMVPDAVDSVSVVMRWVLLFLVRQPEIQTRIQERLDHVLQGRQVTLADRNKLSIIDAVVLETFRRSALLNFPNVHCARHDTMLREHFIPRSVDILANYYSVHMDPVVFPDPEKFSPDRFLDEDEMLCNTDLIMSFGIGRRRCLGEQHVKMILFLMTANILSNFTVVLPPGAPLPPLEPVRGVIQYPQPYQVIFQRR